MSGIVNSTGAKSGIIGTTVGTPVTDLSTATFPAGHVIQTINTEYHGGASDSYTGQLNLTRVEVGSNVYNWKGTIDNVVSGNWVSIDMDFSYKIVKGSSSDIGGNFGIYRNDTEIYHPSAPGDYANAGWYLFLSDTHPEMQHYGQTSMHFIDESPEVGENIYYLTCSSITGATIQLKTESTNNPFTCTLQEIQQ